MPETHVVIFSSSSLFREGLARILTEIPAVKLTGNPQTVGELDRIVFSNKTDFVIIERNENDPLHQDQLSRLLSIPDVRVMSISLNESEIQVYRREFSGEATAENLIALLTRTEN